MAPERVSFEGDQRMSSVSGIEQELFCARCGYDQRGALLTTDGAWPLEVQCAECGERSSMRALVTAGGGVHPWLFEHAWMRGGGWASAARSLLRTLFELLLPWRFWREVGRGHAVRLGPLVLIALFGLVLFLVSEAMARASEIIVWNRMAAAVIVNPGASGPAHIARRFVEWMQLSVHELIGLAAFPAFSGVWPILFWFAAQFLLAKFVVFQFAHRTPAVSNGDLVRVCVYGFVSLTALLAVIFVLAGMIQVVLNYPIGWYGIDLMWRICFLALAPLWLVVWWWIATKRYLHQSWPGARAIGLILASAAIGAPLSFFFVGMFTVIVAGIE
ncbi:MAG: hypothetical protein ACF8PN_05335 [Phycisphaerales bacterium]